MNVSLGGLGAAGLLAAATATALTQTPTLAQAPNAVSPLMCDLAGYAPTSAITARLSGDVLLVQWPGAGEERLRLGLSIVDGTPTIAELAVQGDSDAWATLATDAKIEFTVTEGLRRISNQQLRPLRDLGVELTQDVIDKYKWDVFWDAPLDLRTEIGGATHRRQRAWPSSPACLDRPTRSDAPTPSTTPLAAR